MKTDTKTPYNKPSWLGLGAVLAAIGASVCCVGPLLLLSLGIGGAWISTLTSVESIRPLFIVLTLIFIALGFRQLYLIPYQCEDNGTCTLSGVQRRQRMLFLIGSAFILMLLAFPWFAPFFIG
ncbi:MAG: mercuric transporter MerT family protein [Methylicorpusculum sp.]|nr:mercuric transporter MerT family protein [Methylicorpusculum sp.]MDP3529365.1 mercuric transporter MerT family protein [Methylicorpusculum sp.]MDZ4151402.1 mercuric transporter MerT family protein [Methylicorpusculum sp.]